MIQHDALQNGLKYLNGTNMRKRGSFSYQVKNGTPDIKEQIRKLKELADSPYYGRSEADIAGMILLKQLPKEIKNYNNKIKEGDG